MTNQAVEHLIARSHRLGADPRNTNYGGGNTSAKGTGIDPVTGKLHRTALGEGLRRRPRARSRRPGWRCCGSTGCAR